MAPNIALNKAAPDNGEGYSPALISDLEPVKNSPRRIRRVMPRILAQVTTLFNAVPFFTPRKLTQVRMIIVRMANNFIPDSAKGNRIPPIENSLRDWIGL